MSVKVSNGVREDGSTIYTVADICNGIKHAIKSGAEVVSISISGTSAIGYEEAIARAKEAGVLVVASAGNMAESAKRYPAAMDYVIAVGGTDENNKKCSFSNFGSWVNIVAPAVNYISTTTTSNTAYAKNISGTSFSTPLVAAAIGEMLSVNPTLSVSQVKSYLYGKATDIGSQYFDCGLLNAGLSVQRAKYEDFKNSTVSLTNVKALTDNRIRIYWNDLDVYGPEKVLIYRATSKNGTYKKIKTISGDTICNTYYTDSGLKAGTTYYYKVRIAMEYGEGHKYTPYSNIKGITAKN